MAVIFDMDGTLIDSERIYLEMWIFIPDFWIFFDILNSEVL